MSGNGNGTGTVEVTEVVRQFKCSCNYRGSRNGNRVLMMVVVVVVLVGQGQCCTSFPDTSSPGDRSRVVCRVGENGLECGKVISRGASGLAKVGGVCDA